MPSTRQILATLAAAAFTSSVEAAMGPAFSTGPVGSGSWIREASSTLVLPKAPTTQLGDSSLWVGMGTSNGDLIQSIADMDSNAWSVYGYTLVSTSDTTQMPVQTEPTTAKEGDKITMHYKFDDKSGNYTQYVLVNNKQVATLSTSDGHAMGWGSAVECAADDCGTMLAHKWINTTIILNTADPNYVQTMGKGEGVTGEMSTSDGGITWKVTDINIPQFSFGSMAQEIFRKSLLTRLRWDVFGELDDITVESGISTDEGPTLEPLQGHPIAEEDVMNATVPRIEITISVLNWKRVHDENEEEFRYQPPPPLILEENERFGPIKLGEFVTKVHTYLRQHKKAIVEAISDELLDGEIDLKEGWKEVEVGTEDDAHIAERARYIFHGVDESPRFYPDLSRLSVNIWADGEDDMTTEEYWQNR
ncbi:hypothetical protein P153DRAFT_395105 [Dothidotthia symphoricarpi CBS 119687]|uniref:Uncharacterized protein n=1 Tax=Dothidotthia symphoricarpi CBS 119687 TaxID=1392245 RepID=A0A6A6ALJ0_9PLEO|nr:uncharacterized protein P153DRAFT_395105 [Dothidotthia symphoricarpi CBS 119687]KAF2131804.1 hypothetical protein P153DRAFT_395105 [Dothidotthia symphoricarpi CBS 119687]